MNAPQFPKRAHRIGRGTMTPAQFWCVAHALRIQQPNRDAARRVLVDGITRVQAAEEFPLSRQSIGNSCERIANLHRLILSAYVTTDSGTRTAHPTDHAAQSPR